MNPAYEKALKQAIDAAGNASGAAGYADSHHRMEAWSRVSAAWLAIAQEVREASK